MFGSSGWYIESEIARIEKRQGAAERECQQLRETMGRGTFTPAFNQEKVRQMLAKLLELQREIKTLDRRKQALLAKARRRRF